VTVYAKHSRGFEEGVEVFSFDVIPLAVYELFEVSEGSHWVRGDGDVWVAVGEDDSIELTDGELLAEFGPVTDDEEEVQGCPVCCASGCAGHTRKPSEVKV
jgi:hypothetical protein